MSDVNTLRSDVNAATAHYDAEVRDLLCDLATHLSRAETHTTPAPLVDGGAASACVPQKRKGAEAVRNRPPKKSTSSIWPSSSDHAASHASQLSDEPPSSGMLSAAHHSSAASSSDSAPMTEAPRPSGVLPPSLGSVVASQVTAAGGDHAASRARRRVSAHMQLDDESGSTSSVAATHNRLSGHAHSAAVSHRGAGASATGGLLLLNSRNGAIDGDNDDGDYDDDRADSEDDAYGEDESRPHKRGAAAAARRLSNRRPASSAAAARPVGSAAAASSSAARASTQRAGSQPDHSKNGNSAAAREQPLPSKGKSMPLAVSSVIKTWVVEHASHPYPNKEEKRELMRVTNLDATQLRNYMTNLRKRHWRPVVEAGGRTPRSELELVLQAAAGADGPSGGPAVGAGASSTRISAASINPYRTLAGRRQRGSGTSTDAISTPDHTLAPPSGSHGSGAGSVSRARAPTAHNINRARPVLAASEEETPGAAAEAASRSRGRALGASSVSPGSPPRSTGTSRQVPAASGMDVSLPSPSIYAAAAMLLTGHASGAAPPSFALGPLVAAAEGSSDFEAARSSSATRPPSDSAAFAGPSLRDAARTATAGGPARAPRALPLPRSFAAAGGSWEAADSGYIVGGPRISAAVESSSAHLVHNGSNSGGGPHAVHLSVPPGSSAGVPHAVGGWPHGGVVDTSFAAPLVYYTIPPGPSPHANPAAASSSTGTPSADASDQILLAGAASARLLEAPHAHASGARPCFGIVTSTSHTAPGPGVSSSAAAAEQHPLGGAPAARGPLSRASRPSVPLFIQQPPPTHISAGDVLSSLRSYRGDPDPSHDPSVQSPSTFMGAAGPQMSMLAGGSGASPMLSASSMSGTPPTAPSSSPPSSLPAGAVAVAGRQQLQLYSGRVQSGLAGRVPPHGAEARLVASGAHTAAAPSRLPGSPGAAFLAEPYQALPTASQKPDSSRPSKSAIPSFGTGPGALVRASSLEQGTSFSSLRVPDAPTVPHHGQGVPTGMSDQEIFEFDQHGALLASSNPRYSSSSSSSSTSVGTAVEAGAPVGAPPALVSGAGASASQGTAVELDTNSGGSLSASWST